MKQRIYVMFSDFEGLLSFEHIYVFYDHDLVFESGLSGTYEDVGRMTSSGSCIEINLAILYVFNVLDQCDELNKIKGLGESDIFLLNTSNTMSLYDSREYAVAQNALIVSQNTPVDRSIDKYLFLTVRYDYFPGVFAHDQSSPLHFYHMYEIHEGELLNDFGAGFAITTEKKPLALKLLDGNDERLKIVTDNFKIGDFDEACSNFIEYDLTQHNVRVVDVTGIDDVVEMREQVYGLHTALVCYEPVELDIKEFLDMSL